MQFQKDIKRMIHNFKYTEALIDYDDLNDEEIQRLYSTVSRSYEILSKIYCRQQANIIMEDLKYGC